MRRWNSFSVTHSHREEITKCDKAPQQASESSKKESVAEYSGIRQKKCPEKRLEEHALNDFLADSAFPRSRVGVVKSSMQGIYEMASVIPCFVRVKNNPIF